MKTNCILCGRYIDEGGSGEELCPVCREVRTGRLD